MKKLLIWVLAMFFILVLASINYADRIVTLDTTWLHSVEIMIVPVGAEWTANIEIKGCVIDDQGDAREAIKFTINRKDIPIAIRDQLDAFLNRASRVLNNRGVDEDVSTLPPLN